MISWDLSKTTLILVSLRGKGDSNSIGLIIGDIFGVGGYPPLELVSGLSIGSGPKKIVFPFMFFITCVIISSKIIDTSYLTSPLTGLRPSASDFSISFKYTMLKEPSHALNLDVS